MRKCFRWGLVLLALCLWIAAEGGSQGLAKGRGGGQKGGGRSSVRHAGGKGHKATYSHEHEGGKGHKPTYRHEHGGKTHKPWHDPTDRQLGEGKHPWSKERAKEKRKLKHRLDIADHLDRLADRNGNENLHKTAERMRERAKDHYKRMEKINGKGPFPDLPDGDLGDVADSDAAPDWRDPWEWRDLRDWPKRRDPLDFPARPDDLIPDGPGDPWADLIDPGSKLTGRENALYRQLRNEQRKLIKRLDAAQQLRNAYDRTRDKQLRDAAQLLEDQALDRYERRLDAIRAFQQRHDLPDLAEDLMPPEGISPDPLPRRLDRLGDAVDGVLDAVGDVLGP